MERAVGIGGVFFRAKDAPALRQWYATHLGIEISDWGGHVYEAREGDQTVWAPFARDTDYFGNRKQQWMVNFRVHDLDAMLAQLRAAGVAVEEKIEDDENGRFAWATDPEGNRFELWEPR